jgi:triacylglycerol lipase
VNIIAHSMGGLDARYAITQLGLRGRVASLTTIGTPHYGTPLARAVPLLGGFAMAGKMLGSFGQDLQGFVDLSPDRMTAFNLAVQNDPDVAYASYVGWVPAGSPLHPLLAPGFRYLKRVAGDNDGIVPAASQRWGDVMGEVHADHWAQIGWSRGIDVRLFYEALARRLAEQGF